MRKRRFKDAVLQCEITRPPLPKYPSMEDLTRHLRKIIREEITKRDRELEEEFSKRFKPSSPIPIVACNQHQSPPEFAKPITDCQVVMGETAHFVYVVKSETLVSVQWFHNGSPIITRNTLDGIVVENEAGVDVFMEDKAGCLIFKRSEARHSGCYKCVASNEFGSTQSTAILVVANSKTDDGLDEAIDSVLSETFSDPPKVVDCESQTLESSLCLGDHLLKPKVENGSFEDGILQKVQDELLQEAPLPRDGSVVRRTDDCSGEGLEYIC